MNLTKKLAIVGVTAAILGTLTTVGANASAPPAATGGVGTITTAVTTLVNRPDTATDGTDWAVDQLTRTVWMQQTSAQNPATGWILYAGNIKDVGTAKATAGAHAPNQGAFPGSTIAHDLTAKVTGYGYFWFSADHKPLASNVDKTVTGAGNAAQATSLWVEQAFPVGTKFLGHFDGGALFSPTAWIWTYTVDKTVAVGSTTVTLSSYWRDAAAGGGSTLADGNLTGALN